MKLRNENLCEPISTRLYRQKKARSGSSGISDLPPIYNPTVIPISCVPDVLLPDQLRRACLVDKGKVILQTLMAKGSKWPKCDGIDVVRLGKNRRLVYFEVHGKRSNLIVTRIGRGPGARYRVSHNLYFNGFEILQRRHPKLRPEQPSLDSLGGAARYNYLPWSARQKKWARRLPEYIWLEIDEVEDAIWGCLREKCGRFVEGATLFRSVKLIELTWDVWVSRFIGCNVSTPDYLWDVGSDKRVLDALGGILQAVYRKAWWIDPGDYDAYRKMLGGQGPTVEQAPIGETSVGPITAAYGTWAFGRIKVYTKAVTELFQLVRIEVEFTNYENNDDQRLDWLEEVEVWGHAKGSRKHKRIGEIRKCLAHLKALDRISDGAGERAPLSAELHAEVKTLRKFRALVAALRDAPFDLALRRAFGRLSLWHSHDDLVQCFKMDVRRVFEACSRRAHPVAGCRLRSDIGRYEDIAAILVRRGGVLRTDDLTPNELEILVAEALLEPAGRRLAEPTTIRFRKQRKPGTWRLGRRVYALLRVPEDVGQLKGLSTGAMRNGRSHRQSGLSLFVAEARS